VKKICFESGMDDYMAKPIVTADLERILSTWLKRINLFWDCFFFPFSFSLSLAVLRFFQSFFFLHLDFAMVSLFNVNRSKCVVK
jgi:hypothetical protein